MKKRNVRRLGSAPRRLLKKPEVRKRDTLSDSTRWRRIKEGTYPAPIRISKNRVAWLEDDIEAWISAQLDAAKSR